MRGDIGMASSTWDHSADFPHFYIPCDGFWPSEDHQVELAVAIIDEVTGVATFLEHRILGPVFRVGGVVGHDLLDSLDINLFAVESVGAELLVEESDKLVKVLRDGNTVTVDSRSGMEILGHDGRDWSQRHGARHLWSRWLGDDDGVHCGWRVVDGTDEIVLCTVVGGLRCGGCLFVVEG